MSLPCSAEEGVHVVLDTYEGDTSLPCSSGQGTHSRSVSVEVSSLHSLSASPAVCRGKVSEAVSSGGAVGMGDVRVVESTQEFKAKKQALDVSAFNSVVFFHVKNVIT